MSNLIYHAWDVGEVDTSGNTNESEYAAISKVARLSAYIGEAGPRLT